MRKISFFTAGVFLFLLLFSFIPIKAYAAPTCENVKPIRAMQNQEKNAILVIFSYSAPTNTEAAGGTRIGRIALLSESGKGINFSSSEIMTSTISIPNKEAIVSGVVTIVQPSFSVGDKIQFVYGTGTGEITYCNTVDNPEQMLIIEYTKIVDPGQGGSDPLLPIPKPKEYLFCTSYSTYDVCTDNPSGSEGIVDESLLKIKIRFTNLPPNDPKTSGKNFFYCLKSNTGNCKKDDWEKETREQLVAGIEVCGNGESSLKTKCEIGSDWFHAGKTYVVAVALGKNKDSGLTVSDVLASAPFYVSHFYPDIVSPTEVKESLALRILNISANGLTVTLKGRNIKGGGEVSKYNYYWIQAFSRDTDYKSAEGCIYVPINANGNTTIKFLAVSTDVDKVPLTAGDYVLRIKNGGNGSTTKDNVSRCDEGAFTYWDIPFKIGAEPEPGGVAAPIKDPFEKETGITTSRPTAVPVCPTEAQNKYGYCDTIPTALGNIHTSPEKFIRDIFTIILSIGGIAAIAFFIQAGYTLMTSAGNKEKVGQAREQITAAIMGLIFIILSITILEFIGINILHLPGFGR